jgi:hypothetical protein
MTFDDILRPESKDAPVISRIDPTPERAPQPRRARPEDGRETVDTEPHFPRIFPGI